MGRRFSIAFATLAIVALAVLGGLRWHMMRLSRAAETFLSDFGALQLKESTYHDVAEFSDRHKESLSEVDPACSPENCRWTFSLNNRVLSFFKLVPPTDLKAELYVEHTALHFRSLSLTSLAIKNGSHVSIIERSEREADETHFGVMRKSLSLATVYIYPGATTQQRQAIYGLNVRCLVKLGGCTNLKEMLPSVLDERGAPGPR